MQRRLSCVVIAWTLGFLTAPTVGRTESIAKPALSPEAQAAARQLLDVAGIRGGLVVHLGCGDGTLAAALAGAGEYVVHGLAADDAQAAAARERAHRLGLHGKVSFDRRPDKQLPYIDNLVNLLVVDDAGGVGADEQMRAVAPGGVVCVRQGNAWTKRVKPRPANIDEWNQYLRDSSNNAVAHDQQVGPPRHVQWVADPNWSRHHDHMASVSALVATKDRIFYIVDEGRREAIVLPGQWMLVARDAFSGMVLWKRPIPEWNTQLWPLKSGPNQLPRRLAAVGDRVYVTLGIDAPVEILDAATGKTVATVPGSEYADEILEADGVLYLLVGAGPNQWKQYRPKFTYVWSNTQRANKEWAWDEKPRTILAADAQTGKALWKVQQAVAPLTLAADDKRLYCFDGQKAVALDRQGGKSLWSSSAVPRKNAFPTGYGPTLVVEQDVVLLSVENRSMHAFDSASGKSLWSAEHHRGGHASPDDLLVIDGLVWSGAVANGADSGIFTGRDLHTGEKKREFKPDVAPDWFHHRCYRSRATDNFFLASRTGIELIDLKAEHWDINHWVRGGCLYGFMPANGLLYIPPHACGCFLESKLFGFNALAAPSPTRIAPREVPDAGRLERGPAWGQVADAAESKEDWPTYRHDPMRSAASSTSVSPDARLAWRTRLGGRLSSVVIAGGKVFVAAIDQHTLYALDAETGKIAWHFLAGGRIDSPPTLYRGRALFGSADGWVYCVDSRDGRLAWRFRAAPVERRLTAYDQLESAWPVSGSVLVAGDAVYCVAGRSSFLDGGMRLVRLDPRTGAKLGETLLEDRDPATGEGLQAKIKGQDMPVALPDILSCDGKSIYMRAQAFDMNGALREVAPIKLGEGLRKGKAEAAARDDVGDHIFSRSGFLDSSWFFRSYWIYGKAVDSNYGGWLRPGHFAPCGRLMAIDDANVFSFDRKPEYLCNAAVQEYYLYRADRQVGEEGRERVRQANNRINAASSDKSASSSDFLTRRKFSITEQNPSRFHWAAGSPPIQARALLLAGQVLFVAGPPILVNEEEAWRTPDNPAIREKLAEQVEAFEGRRGGQLLALAAADGRKLAAWELGAAPTFDGMAAAGNRLYLSTLDGAVMALGKSGEPLAPAPESHLMPLDVSVKESNVPPAWAGRPSLRNEFITLSHADVYKSDLGYEVRADDKTGLALKKLEKPLSGKVHLRAKMQIANDTKLKNGFLVFGQESSEAALVHCGLRFAMSKAMIVEGPVSGKGAEAKFTPDAERIYVLDVVVDLPAGTVTMQAGDATVTAKLKGKLEKIAYVGYAAVNAATQFSAVEIVP